MQKFSLLYWLSIELNKTYISLVSISNSNIESMLNGYMEYRAGLQMVVYKEELVEWND